jgi:hypothetical protein
VLLSDKRPLLPSFTREVGLWSWSQSPNSAVKLGCSVSNSKRLLAPLSGYCAVEAASPWQQMAIGDVTPMLEELAANVTMTIYNLGESPDRLIFSSFPEYVAANAEIAADIAQVTSDYVAYGEDKQKAKEVADELQMTARHG